VQYSPDTWAVLAYLVLVALGIVFNLSQRGRFLRTETNIPRFLEKAIAGVAALLLTIAIGVGVSIAATDPAPAIYWFSVAGICAVLGVFFLDDIKEMQTWKRAVIVLVTGIIAVMSVKLANKWVADKAVASSIVSQEQSAFEGLLEVGHLRETSSKMTQDVKSKPPSLPEFSPPTKTTIPIPLRPYDLTGRRREIFLALLNTQSDARDTIRVGCIGWIEDSCVAAGKFLLLFSEAGWKIDSGRVFRFDPAIPPEGMTIAAKSPKYTDNLPPHLGHWGAMDASQVTFWQTFWWMQIPVGATGDPDMPEGTIGIYFGAEPKNVNLRTAAQTQEQLTQIMGWMLIQLKVLERTCSTQIDTCKTKEIQLAKVISVLLAYCDCGLNKSWPKKWDELGKNEQDDPSITITRQDQTLQRFAATLKKEKLP
jgi:hypothetical protein